MAPTGARPPGLRPSRSTPPRPSISATPPLIRETPSTWGFAAPPRRVFGLAVWKDRLYYAVAQGPQVWSVGLGQDGAFTSDVRFEADVPALQDGVEIASITFDQNHMYLAERGSLTGDYSLSNLASEGASRVLRFSQKPAGDGSPGFWKLTPDEYAIGLAPNYDNADGGVALGYGYQQGGGLDLGACRATLWSTGERLLDPGDPNAAPDSYPALDGLQGNSPNLVKPQNQPPTQAWFVGYYDQPGSPLFRGHMGAVVILSPCGEQVTYAPPPPPPPVLRCPPGSTYQDGQCVVTVSCPRGSVYRSGYCVYESCPPGYVRYRNQCVPPPQTCPPGTAFYEGDCVPVGCPPGMRQLPSGYCACPLGDVFYRGTLRAAERLVRRAWRRCRAASAGARPTPTSSATAASRTTARRATSATAASACRSGASPASSAAMTVSATRSSIPVRRTRYRTSTTACRGSARSAPSAATTATATATATRAAPGRSSTAASA